jgi:hypothetical protein
VSKRKGSPIIQGDIIYTNARVRGGRACTLTLPCLGEGDEFKFETDSGSPGTDEKHASNIVASKALEALFADCNIAVHEAHLTAAEAALNKLDPENSTPADPAVPAVDPEGEPKGLLNSRVQVAVSRQICSGDITYDTNWNFVIRGYTCVLTVRALDAENNGGQVFTADAPNSTDKRVAEKAAARIALEANKPLFDEALEKREQKKAQEAKKKADQLARQKGCGKGNKGDRRDSGRDNNFQNRRERSRSQRRERSRSHNNRRRERSRSRGRDYNAHAGYGAPPAHGPPPGYGPPPAYGPPPGCLASKTQTVA